MERQAGLPWEIKLAQGSCSLWLSMIQCPLIIYEVVRHPSQVTDRLLSGYRDTIRWPLSLCPFSPSALPAAQVLSSRARWCSPTQRPANPPSGPPEAGRWEISALSTLPSICPTVAGEMLYKNFFHSWVTRFCQFLLYSKGTQSHIYIYTFFFSHYPPSCSITGDWI